MLWIKVVETVDSVDDFKSSHSIQGYTHFPNFKMLDARIASALNKIIHNSYFKKKVSLKEQKAQKEDRFLRERQIGYMITGAHDTVLDYADLFTIHLRNDDVREFDTRWDEILLSMSKIPPDDVWQACTSWEHVSLINSEPYWKCMTMKFIRRYRKRIIRGWKQRWREASETQSTKLWRQIWEDWNRSSGYESQGSTWCWQRTRRMLSIESKRTVFERRRLQFPARWE